MKFRTTLILFNVIILLLLLLVFALPLFLVGPGGVDGFLLSAWPLAGGLLLCALGMNVFFAVNFRFYTLLEREDWPALARYLERRVLGKGRFSSWLVEPLVNTWLAMSDFTSLRGLEDRIALEKPELLEKHALLFGAAKFLAGDHAGAERFFADRCGGDGGAEGDGGGPPAKRRQSGEDPWLRWYLGLALLSNRRYDRAADVFGPLARSSRDPFAAGLAAWFLLRSLVPALPGREAELSAALAEGRVRVLRMLPRQDAWRKAAGRRGGDLHLAVLSNYCNEAAAWLYASDTTPGEPGQEP